MQFRVSCASADLPPTSAIHNRHRRMAGDDEDDDDDDVNNDHVTARMVTSPMGLPPTVVALLGRMTSYRDRMAWTVVEDACRVCLTLSWDVDDRRRQRSLEAPYSGGGGTTGPATACKESLWSRIRRSLHSRRSVSVDLTTADVRRRQQHVAASHWRSRDAGDERSHAARDMWRSAVRRHRSASVGRGSSGPGDVGAAEAWRRRRQRSWNDAEVVQLTTDVKDSSTGDSQSRGRLLPSMSLPERFLSPPPHHHHHHHHLLHRHQPQQQQQKLTPQELYGPQYDCSVSAIRQTQPSVSSPSLSLSDIINTSC